MNELLTKREIELIRILSDSNGFIGTNFLCERMDIKSRTLRECIRGFRDAHEKSAGVRIESRPGLGYRMVIENKDRYYEFLKSMLEAETQNQYVMPADPDDRVKYIVRYLLGKNDYIKADELSDQLYISRSTFAEDLKAVRSQLFVFSLTLKSVPGKGIRIDGEEKNIRNAIAEYYFQGEGVDSLHFEESVSRYFTREEYERVRTILYDTIRRNEFRMADDSFRNLVIHLLIALRRIQDGTYIGNTDDRAREELRNTKEWQIAEEIYRTLTETYQLTVPESEIEYVTVHLRGKKMISDDNEMVLYPETLNLITEIFWEIHREFGIDFTGDIELYRGLSMHLQPLLERAKYGLHVNNPILQDIRQDNPAAFEIAVFSADVIRKKTGALIGENEIGFLALHFSLALERLKTKRRKRIVVICASGAGTSKLLAYKLRKRFSDTAETIDTMSYYDLQDHPDCGYDLILSTVPISFRVSAPVIRIREIPNNSDLDRVDAAMNESDEEFDQLCRCFDPELFFEQQFDTPEEVIRFLSGKIRERYDLDDHFEEYVLEREKLSPTAIGNLVAFPHPNRLTQKKTRAAVLKLPQRISWNGTKVQLVILASLQKEDDRVFRMFSEMIADFVGDRAMVDSVIGDCSYGTLTECFRQLYRFLPEEEQDIFQ